MYHRPPDDTPRTGDSRSEMVRSPDAVQDVVPRRRPRPLSEVLQKHINLLYFRGWTLFVLGCLCVRAGTIAGKRSERFGPGNKFAKLRATCTAFGVYRESSTESLTREGIDGVEREHFSCVDTRWYNFSVGTDHRIERSGPERVRRSEMKCEATASEGANLTSTGIGSGERVDCWRPVLHLQNITLEGIPCGRPLCNLADVYSCDNPDCVQVSDPAGQFIVFTGEESALKDFGWYLNY
jgi:hypothetical protein